MYIIQEGMKLVRTKILGHKDREEKLIESVQTANFNWTRAQELLELNGIYIISSQIRSNYDAIKNRENIQNRQINGIITQLSHRRLLIDLVYEFNFNGQKILAKWKEITGQEQNLHFIQSNFVSSYRKLKKKLIKCFVRKKKLYLKLHPIKSGNYTTLKLLSTKFKDQIFEDSDLQNMTKAAVCLEKLMKLYESRIWYERSEFYEEFSQITNKRDATNCLDKIRYLQSLIKLRQKEKLEDQSNNPICKYLLETSVYQNIYKNFNSIEDIDETFKMKFNDQFQKHKTITQQSEIKKLNISQRVVETKKGRILNKKKTTKCRIFDSKTTNFNHEHVRMLDQLEQEQSDIDGLLFEEDEEMEKKMEQNKELTDYIVKKTRTNILMEQLFLYNK